MSITKPQKILISGGGMGGLTLAYFLKQFGFTPVIIDSAPEYKHIGYMLALNLQIGQQVAKKMGVLDKLETFEIPLTRNIIYDMNERLIMDYQATKEMHADNSGLMINRADLHLTLYDKVKNDVEVRFGQQIETIAQHENGADVIFSNGKKETFDLVIGADGVHSKTRELVFGKGFEKYIGTSYFAFIIPNRTNEPVAEENELISIRGKGFWLAYHAMNKSEIGGYIFHEAEEFDSLDPKDRRNYMIEKYGKYNKKFLQILETLKDDDFIYHGPFTLTTMPTWHKDRVCLIGDAAHCPTPASGVGASMAMAGAYILAKKLSEESDYRKAFEAYEAYIRPYISKVQSSAKWGSQFIAGKSLVLYGLVNTLLRILPTTFITKIHTHKLEMPLP